MRSNWVLVPPAGVMRGALQGIEGIHAVLRRLHGDRITYAVGGIEPLIGRHLAAGTERDQHAVGDVALGEPSLIGFQAIDVDHHSGRVHFLADEDVYGPGNRFDFLADFARHFVIRRGVAAHDLDIDGHGKAEIQNLVRDVRRLEEESLVGESPVQIGAQDPLVFLSAVALVAVERDQNFAVGRGDGSGVAECEIDAAVGQADVVENLIDLAGRDQRRISRSMVREDAFGLFDARALPGARTCRRIWPEST